jgi:integrase/recombinase XerD
MEIESAVARIAAAGGVSDDDPLVDALRGVLGALHAPGSVRTYASDLADLATFFRDRRRGLAAATRDDLTAYAADLTARGLSPDTRRRRAVVTRSFYREAAERGLLPGPAPVSRVRVKEASPVGPPALDATELAALLAWPAPRLADPDPRVVRTAARDHLLLTLLVYTGLRISEAVALTVGQLGREGGRAVLRDVRGKGGTKVIIPVPDAVAEEIRTFAADADERDPLLPAMARGRGGRPLSVRQARRIIDAALSAVGHSEARSGPHLLRASAITAVYLGSRDAVLTQRFARHARADTTDRYIRPADALADAGIDYLAVADPTGVRLRGRRSG